MDGGRERARGLCRSAGRCSTARRGTLRGHTRLPTLLRVLGVGQRVTLPALRQPVQTLSRLGAPLTVARTRWMFGSNRRLVILRDHGRLLPKPGPLPQTSQTAATVNSQLVEIEGPARAAGSDGWVSPTTAGQPDEDIGSGPGLPNGGRGDAGARGAVRRSGRRWAWIA